MPEGILVSDVELVPYEEAKPPKRLTEKQAVTKAEHRVRRSLARHIAKLEELAKGVYIVEPTRKGHTPKQLILRDTETGEEEVLGFGLAIYKTLPSREALQYLIDRGMGKPPQRQELTGAEGTAIQIVPWATSNIQVIDGD